MTSTKLVTLAAATIFSLTSIMSYADDDGDKDGKKGGRPAPTAPAPTAVPEPETYGMMLAGLGLIGFAARRKLKAKQTTE